MARLLGLTACSWMFGLAACLCAQSLALAAPPAASPPSPPPQQPEWPSLVVMLIRDPAVHAELGLSPEQIAQVEAAVQAVDRELWVLRDVPPAEGIPRQDKLVAQVSAALKTGLKTSQRQRFDQLLVQARGVDGLARPSVAKRLGLSSEQLAQMQTIQTDAAKSADQLKQQAGGNVSPALKEQLAKLQADRQRQLGEVLTVEQRQRLGQLTGEPFEFARIKRIAAQAPELTGVDRWFNGEPRSLADLRGKVVVLHFFAFGCINCIHNYPHYKTWQQHFAGRDMVILGVHTPETEAERQLEGLKAKLTDDGLTFPVAVDAQNQTWNAWGNHIWPAVYLIDKQGRVRYWWYGELEWNGAGGEAYLRGKIEELLGESSP
ncbi:MAG: redoxin domain-containing protein [Pirellulales bacterium]